jgi:stage II sporulation protein D
MLTMRSTYHRLHLRRLIPAASLVWLLLLAGIARASDLLVVGAGDGHGVGMSQEGARGYAERGWSYRAILAHYYTATAIGRAPPGTRVRVLIAGKVHNVALESYVRGVVSAEVPSSWPLAALEAQAVASRTYALTAHSGGSRFDVYSDTRSQVFRGVAAETPETDAAVAATAGQVVTYEGRPAITYFFASSGGRTENVENGFPGALPEPWLRGTPDPFDQGPLHSWKLTISFASAAARLGGLVRGSLQGIEVRERGFSPRILSAYVLGSAGRTVVSGSGLAARLGLYDTWAYFSVRSAQGVKREPDLSGQPAVSSPSSPSGSASLPSVRTPSGNQGGAQAVGQTGESEASAAKVGGTAAPV